MKRILTIEAINKKIERIKGKYNQPLDEYNTGKYTGWIDALLYIKNTYKLPKTK